MSFTGGADGARSVLAAIATSIITVTSLTFSLSVVTLQLASSQFSPRLLRTFLPDLRNQTVLATLLATFLYSLTVLRIIRSGNGNSDDDVPELAVSVSYLLVIASVLALVWYLHHVVSVIRVDTLTAGVRDETLRVASRTSAARPDDDKSAAVDVPMPALPRDTAPVLSRQSGFLLAVDTDGLEAWARAQNVVVAIDARPGHMDAARSAVGARLDRRRLDAGRRCKRTTRSHCRRQRTHLPAGRRVRAAAARRRRRAGRSRPASTTPRRQFSV